MYHSTTVFLFLLSVRFFFLSLYNCFKPQSVLYYCLKKISSHTGLSNDIDNIEIKSQELQTEMEWDNERSTTCIQVRDGNFWQELKELNEEIISQLPIKTRLPTLIW